ncbi:hypothetical protein SMMN14_05002 [Sphaerulina musiva]
MGIKADMIAGEAAMEELESIINGEILAENFMLEDTVNEDLQSSVESDFSSEEENTTIEELDLREERSFSDEDLIDEDIELFRKRRNNPLFASFHTPYIDSVMNEVEDIKNLVNIDALGADTSPIDEAYPTPYDWVEYENDVAEVTAENNDIVEVFGEQFATIAATGGNLLSAWLLISAYFHVCKVAGTWVPGKLTKERSASLVSEYGHLILRAATKSVEEISRFTASLGSNNMPPAPQQQQQQQQQQQKQHLPPRWQQLFHEFSLQGFEHEDLMMQFRKLLGETSNPKIAETIFEQTFRNLSAETRLLTFAPALQQYFFFPHSCSSNDETTSDDDDDALRALITKFNPEANLMFLNNMKKNKDGNTRISEKEKIRLSRPAPPPSSPYPVSKRSLQSQGQSQEKKKKMQKTKTEKKKKKTVTKTGSSNDGSKKKVGGGVSAGRVMKKGKPVIATAAAASGTKMTNSATTTSNTAATIGARRYNLRKRK